MFSLPQVTWEYAQQVAKDVTTIHRYIPDRTNRMFMELAEVGETTHPVNHGWVQNIPQWCFNEREEILIKIYLKCKLHFESLFLGGDESGFKLRARFQKVVHRGDGS